MRVFLDMLERHYGKRPIIYTDPGFFDENGLSALRGYPFWLRSVAAEPHERYRNRTWTFWQWTQTGTMSGIHTEVDRNAFYGSGDEWVRFLLTGCDPRSLHRLGPQGRCQSLK